MDTGKKNKGNNQEIETIMKKLNIYVDTSVIGGCLDEEFKLWSLSLLKDFQNGYFNLLLSELIENEINHAHEEVHVIYAEFKKYAFNILEITSEMNLLSDTYLARKILSNKFKADALHIAAATIANADLLVSWNFKHIVHYDKIQKFNGVNIELGYKTISIYSPREVTTYDKRG